MSQFVVTEARTRVDGRGVSRVCGLVSKRVVEEQDLPTVLNAYRFPKRAKEFKTDNMSYRNTLVRWDARKS